MTIKHLVISGGGPLGLRYLGALEKLEKENFWKVDNIESIYGTSVGSMIGAFICLKYDWETLNKYIIERPWNDAFKINAQQIVDSYYKKGLFDSKLIEIIFKPLLQAKNIETTVTLKEFYEFSKIDFHIFTFELNNFETIELSHITHPNLSLLQALTMSSAFPGIFMPTIIDKKCYIDGGAMCNYPINQCLRDNSNKDEILGIQITYDKDNNAEVTEELSLLEYVMCFTNNAMNFIRSTVKLENINNTIECNVTENCSNFLDLIQQTVINQELRQQWIQMGEEDATNFLSKNVSVVL
jgi:predicted acylesterase/phospholipase RssA